MLRAFSFTGGKSEKMIRIFSFIFFFCFSVYWFKKFKEMMEPVVTHYLEVLVTYLTTSFLRVAQLIKNKGR